MSNTPLQYQTVIDSCSQLFEKKTKDYGTAWRILRLSTLTDQIFIKAKRLRSIQEKGVQKVEDSKREEFMGIVNYCIIALIQQDYIYNEKFKLELDADVVMNHYNEKVKDIQNLLSNKNHDYGEAWRDMRISSMTDIILMKLYRIKQIEDNDGETIVSEGITAGYQDIVNYAVFCMILMDENGGG